MKSPSHMIARVLLSLLVLGAGGCATIERSISSLNTPARTYAAPISRVKPAFVTTLASMGMSITALEARGGRDIVKARKAGTNVEIDLESVGRGTTRARVSASTGGLTNDAAVSAQIFREAERLLGAG